MALLFYDGFDWVSSGVDILKVWDAQNSVVYGGSYGRFGSKGVALTTSGGYLHKYFSSRSTIYFGAAFIIDPNVIQYNLSYPIFDFKNNTTSQVRFHFNSLISCSFYNGSGTQIGTDITIPNVGSKWQYIEIKVTISDTVGAIALRLNGVEYYNGTNLDTRNGTPTDINFVDLSACNSSSTFFDDIYIDDAQFHGDVRIRTIFPDANGSVNNFSVYPSGSNYQAVDDSAYDGDSTYNSADTVGNIDLYKVTAPTLGIVRALSVSNMLRKDDAGDRKIKNLCRSGGSNYQGLEYSVPSSYYMNKHIWETDPQDSQAWTKEKIDAAEFGLEITA